MSSSGNFVPPEFQIYTTSECKACEVLKSEVAYLRQQNKELTETLTALLKPKPVVVGEPVEVTGPINPQSAMWSRRRAILEAADRVQAARMKESPIAAKPDEGLTEALERELEIPSIAEG